MRERSITGSSKTPPNPGPAERQLGDAGNAFAGGDSRLCFVDPLDPGWCIKILRPDRTPARKRREQSWLKRLKPLQRFDDNLQDIRVYRWLERSIGEAAYRLVPRIDGMVPTNLGPGLRSELIRDDDGNISLTLQTYLSRRWECRRGACCCTTSWSSSGPKGPSGLSLWTVLAGAI